MLETHEELGEIVRAAMSDLGLNQQGRLELQEMLPDSVGSVDRTNGTTEWREPPRWTVNITYPAGDGSNRLFVIEVNASLLKNRDEVRQFIVSEIQGQMVQK